MTKAGKDTLTPSKPQQSVQVSLLHSFLLCLFHWNLTVQQKLSGLKLIIELYALVFFFFFWSSLWWYIPVKVMSAKSEPVYVSMTSSGPGKIVFTRSASSKEWLSTLVGSTALSWLVCRTLPDLHVAERKEELVSRDGRWILANVNRVGYYRVNYDLENWERLLKHLESDHQVSFISSAHINLL